MAESGELEVDMLFLGLTRPAMIFGVSYMIVGMNFITCMFFYILSSSFKVIPIMLVLHLVAYLLSQKEPLFLQLFMVKQQKCNKCKNRFFHGMTNSYDIS